MAGVLEPPAVLTGQQKGAYFWAVYLEKAHQQSGEHDGYAWGDVNCLSEAPVLTPLVFKQSHSKLLKTPWDIKTAVPFGL